MPKRRKHRSKDAYDGNERIPIRVDVLKAALDACGWGPSALADAVGARQQTISALVRSSEGRRCRRELSVKIAGALEIPFELLTGGPVVEPWTPLVPDGFEFRYSLRTELAASRLLTKCQAACKRDLKLSGSDLRPGAPPHFACMSLTGLVAEMIQVGRWRNWVLEWDAEALAERGYTEPASDPWEGELRERDPQPDPATLPPGMIAMELVGKNKPKKDPAHEEAVLGLVRGIEHILTPWFEGKAKLNYEALQRLTYLPQPYPTQSHLDSFSPLAAMPQPTKADRPKTGPPTRRKK